MNQKYKSVIEDYCNNNDIFIPPGFYRHSPSHIVVVRYDSGIGKLVARTFFKITDLKHCITTYLLEKGSTQENYLPAKVLNFKELLEYRIDSAGKLVSPKPIN